MDREAAFRAANSARQELFTRNKVFYARDIHKVYNAEKGEYAVIGRDDFHYALMAAYYQGMFIAHKFNSGPPGLIDENETMQAFLARLHQIGAEVDPTVAQGPEA